MALADFEVASVSEWAKYCSHRDFCEVYELTVGSRFDVRAQKDTLIKAKTQAGQAAFGKFTVSVPGLAKGSAAFVEIVGSDGQTAIAVPLVFLQEKPQAPAFVNAALLPSEKLVFAAQHQNRTSILTSQRAMSFDQGKLRGTVAVADALISRHEGSLVIHGNDESGIATAVSFKGLYSPLSIERLLCGLKAAAMSANMKVDECPDSLIENFFSASVESTIFNAVVQSPGITVSEVSHATGLNRYLCRSVLRGLYLEGRVIPQNNGFWPAFAKEQPTPSEQGHFSAFEDAACEQEKQGASAEAAEAHRQLEELAQQCYQSLARQKELERQVDSLHSEVKVLSSAADPEISELKLQMSRLESELASALRKLDDTDSEYQTNLAIMAEKAKWAADKAAHLSWANDAVTDKAQRKISEYKTYLSARTRKSTVSRARKSRRQKVVCP